MTPGGVLPLGFEIDAKDLAEAVEKFPDAVKQALEDAINEAQEMRREAASRIVVPDAGGMPGPGKIKFP
jgi:DNA-binding protein YbaB